MKSAIKSGLVALSGTALLLVSAFPAWGQSRGGGARISGGSHAGAIRVAPRATARPASLGFSRFTRVTPTRATNFSGISGVRTVRDRYGRLHRVRSVAFIGGYPGYFPYDYGYGDAPYDSSYDSGQPAAYADSSDQAAAPRPAETMAAAPQTPERDIGKLILMRNDGQVLFASAFTISGDSLTYITQEGARRSFPVAELDKDTTRKMNDANGTSVVIPD